MNNHAFFVERFRGMAADVDALRQQKAHDLNRQSATEAAEAIISNPECNRAWLEVEGNRLFLDLLQLRSMPDVVAYDAYVAPPMDDCDEFDF